MERYIALLPKAYVFSEVDQRRRLVGLPDWGKDYPFGWRGYDWRFFGGHNYAYKVAAVLGTDRFWKQTAWYGLTMTLANLAGLFFLDWKTALWALGSSIGFNEALSWGFEKGKVALFDWLRGQPEHREKAEAALIGLGFSDPSTFGTTRFQSGSSGVYCFLAGWLLYASRYTGQWGSIPFAFGSKLWFPQGAIVFPFWVSATVVSEVVLLWVISLGEGGGKIDHPTHLMNLFVGSLLGWWLLPKKIAPIFRLPGWLSWTLGVFFVFLFTFGQGMFLEFIRTYLIGDDYVREPEMTTQEIMALI